MTDRAEHVGGDHRLVWLVLLTATVATLLWALSMTWPPGGEIPVAEIKSNAGPPAILVALREPTVVVGTVGAFAGILGLGVAARRWFHE